MSSDQPLFMQAWFAAQALELAVANLHFFTRLAQLTCDLGRTKILPAVIHLASCR